MGKQNVLLKKGSVLHDTETAEKLIVAEILVLVMTEEDQSLHDAYVQFNLERSGCGCIIQVTQNVMRKKLRTGEWEVSKKEGET